MSKTSILQSEEDARRQAGNIRETLKGAGPEWSDATMWSDDALMELGEIPGFLEEIRRGQ